VQGGHLRICIETKAFLRMHQPALVIALIGALGIGAQWIAWRTGWPAIALMLLGGALVGPVTGLIVPHDVFGSLLEPIVSIAVALILFEGGLSLNVRELRRTDGAVTRLVLLGVPIGWGLGTLALYYAAGLVWPVATLFAGILVVTYPTVVLPLLRQSNVAQRPRAILKWEAIVNDPIGALLAVALVAEIIVAVGAWSAGKLALGRRLAPVEDGVPNIEAIGTLLYTRYLFVFEGAGLVLLVAMIGAIVLTHRKRQGVKPQNIARQIARRPQDATRNVNQPVGQGVEL